MNGGREFVGAMGDVENGDSAGADETINSLNERGPVGRIEALAGLVEDEEAGIFDQGTGEQCHSLRASGKAVEGSVRIRKEPEIGELEASASALPTSERLEKTDGIVKPGSNDFETGGVACEVEVQFG